MSITQYNKILKAHFGYETLKPEQYDIISHLVTKKQDVNAILATGFGKSLCFQMPHLITKLSVIIISPLIALMEDQKTLMEALDIPVCCLNSACVDKSQIKREILDGENKLIYITPEYLPYCETFVKELVEQDGLALIAIDESHAVSTYGMDFRPAYKELGIFREWAPNVPILAVTATASERVRQDIVKILKLKNPHTVIGNFDRPNLFISVNKKTSGSDMSDELTELINKYKGQYTIIYCKTRADTEKITESVQDMGIDCGAYHAGMSTDDRSIVQQKFISGEIKCIAATIAFGMGINVAAVRLVVHYGCPKNIESYYQEIGRAGRDGLRSECYLIFSTKDFALNRFFLKTIKDANYKRYQEEQLINIEKYVYTNECRRKVLLKLFGGDVQSCTMCDNCTAGVKVTKKDCTYQAYLLMHLVRELEGKYGAGTYVDILRGSSSKKMTGGMKTARQYNKGISNSAEWWKTFLRNMINYGFLQEKQIAKSFGSVVNYTPTGVKWINNLCIKYPKITSETKIAETDKIYIEYKDTGKPEPKTGIDLSMEIMQQEIDDDKKPVKKTIDVSGANKRWSVEEEKKLINSIKTKSIKDIALDHKRTVGGIQSRLKGIAFKLFLDGKTVADISKITTLSESDITKIITSKGGNINKDNVEENEPEEINTNNDDSDSSTKSQKYVKKKICGKK